MPANSGHKVDVKGETFLGQCKETKTLSLAQMTDLVMEIEAEAEKVGKRGVLFVKLRSGKGSATPLLCVMSEKNWAHKCVACGGPAVSGAICASCVASG
jgi:hypothetical protein